MPRKRETTESVRDQLANPPPRRAAPAGYLSTGVQVVNLAVSGRSDGGIPLGGYIWFVGDSESGKTFFALTMLAEAANNPAFDKYQLFYDNSEHGNLPDILYFFKTKASRRIRIRSSSTAEEFYRALYDAMKRGPVVWIEDSMDALRTKTDDANYEKVGTGVKTTGDYGTAKAKVNSSHVGRVVQRLEETGSVLVIISQVRDKIGTTFPVKTYSGGKALKHYANVQVWTKVKEELTARALGRDRQTGAMIQVDTHKNRVNGWHGRVYVPFYRNFGLDDVGASVHFLVDEGYWRPPKKKAEDNGREDKGRVVVAAEFDFTGTEEQIVQRIREEAGQPELKAIVERAWQKIEAACSVQRDSPYV